MQAIIRKDVTNPRQFKTFNVTNPRQFVIITKEFFVIPLLKVRSGDGANRCKKIAFRCLCLQIEVDGTGEKLKFAIKRPVKSTLR
ncbi:MAG: hypothetical protein ACLFQS_00535, partial [Bacteroidales bacterium]